MRRPGLRDLRRGDRPGIRGTLARVDDEIEREERRMVISVFRSRLRPEGREAFQEHAARLMELAESMPGFLSYKAYVSDDGERCSIVEFGTHEQLLAWRNLPEHRRAQEVGRERYYESYTLHVAEPVRASRFPR